MQKVLLKLFIPLFILAALNPGAYSLTGPDSNGLTDHYHASIKKQAQALPLVKNAHAQTVVTYIVHGFVKPLWIGSISFSPAGLANNCNSLFILSKRNVIYRQEFLTLLLFPFHFFG